MPGVCSFQSLWLDKTDYKSWLRKDATSKKTAFCAACKKKIDISSMGEGALTSHMKGAKHKKNVAATDKLVAPIHRFMGLGSQQSASSGPLSSSTSTPVSSTSTAPVLLQKGQQSHLTCTVSGTDVLKAELLWVMKCVTSHYSMKSCEGLSKLYQTMFPDSSIAAGFSCGESKASYICNFGLSSYFASELCREVKAASNYVLMFDETLNHDLQEKQLDIHLKFWKDDSVVTRYYDSRFMGHAHAEAILDELSPTITSIGHSKLLQLSMDGPNVNKKVERLLKEDIAKQTPLKMLDIGTCGLHVLHNAFRAGCAAATWELETFLSSAYHLFHDSPARRDDFLEQSGAVQFPMKFCKHRWLENTRPAQRAIDILPHLVAYCAAAKTKTVTEPSCKSFKEVIASLGDPLLKTKLEFFISIAQEMEPFLALYQTDRPMIPFLGSDLGTLIKDLMRKIVKADLLGESASTKKALLVNLKDNTTLRDPSKVEIGFCAKQSIVTTKASDRDRYRFRMECRDCVKAILEKVLEKAPVKYKLVRKMSWLEPKTIVSTTDKTKTQALDDLEQTLSILCEAGRAKAENCDHIRKQYVRFCEEAVTEDSNAFRSFDHKLESHRIDCLFHKHLAGKANYKELWNVIQQLLLLSHGQATVERGFSVNKETTVENLKKENLKARRLVIQAVRQAGGVQSVPITKELLSHVSTARRKYYEHLERKRQEAISKRVAEKRKADDADLDDLKSKRRRIIADADALEKSADLKAQEAEKKAKLTLISESNALRKRSQEKRKQAKDLDDMIQEKIDSRPKNK